MSGTLKELGENVQCDLLIQAYYNSSMPDLMIISCEFLSMGTWALVSRIFYQKLPVQKFDLEALKQFASFLQSNLFVNIFYDNLRKGYYLMSFETQTGKRVLEQGGIITGEELKRMDKSIG